MGTVERGWENIMGIIRRWFDKRRRKMDVEILWRVCLEVGGNRDTAKKVFYWHVMSDPVWTDYYSEDELCQIVSDL